MPMRHCLFTSALLAAALFVIGAAQAASTQPAERDTAAEAQLSPEQQMNRRFPQPARVRALIGRPVLDDYDNTLGYVLRVVRTQDSKLQLIVRYGGWFGWIGWWQRPVAVSIERVALIGPHVAAIDMPPQDFRNAPTWQPSADSSELAADETIRVAITRR